MGLASPRTAVLTGWFPLRRINSVARMQRTNAVKHAAILIIAVAAGVIETALAAA